VRDIRTVLSTRTTEDLMSVSFRAGLGVLGLLSAADLALPLLSDGEHPPMPIALVAAGIGLASLVLIVFAVRGSRRATIALIVLRTLSALAAVPAFYEAGVPATARILAGAGVALTILGIALVLTPSRRVGHVGAR
jgi:hypothetical protein